jgi:hypothetical protein
MKINGLHNVVPFEVYKGAMYGNENISGLNYIKLWNKWEADHKELWLDIFKWYANKKGHNFKILEEDKEQFEIEKKLLKENIERLELSMNILPIKCEDIYNGNLLSNIILDGMPDIITNNARDKLCEKDLLSEDISDNDPEIELDESPSSCLISFKS